MGKATLAKQRAVGLIGQACVTKLYDEGALVVIFAAELECMTQQIAELKRQNRLLSAAVNQADDVAALVLKEAMQR
jgi:hypothetical protein